MTDLPARRAPRLLALCLLACLMGLPASAQTRFGVREARRGVVLIKRLAPGEEPAVGSGFLVSKDGLVYTNRHVALPPEDGGGAKGLLLVGVPTPADPDKLTFYRAELAFAPDKETGLDFAVLKIADKKGGPGFSPLPLSFAAPELGGDVAVLGYPVVKEDQPHLSFTRGSVSVRKVEINGRSYCQTDAAINPGNSGGPLLNERGEAVGIVTLKKRDASNIGFALLLEETKKVLEDNKAAIARVKATPGPVDPRDVKVPGAVTLDPDDWVTVQGTSTAVKGGLVVDNNGGRYWLAAKEALPEHFRLKLLCQVEFLQGRQVLQRSQRSILRCLYVRFATDDQQADIAGSAGCYLVRYTHANLTLFPDKQAEKVEQKGNTDARCLITVTKRGGDISVALDGEVLLRHHDDRPLDGGRKLCLGGYLSRLRLERATVITLDAPPGYKSPGGKKEAKKGHDRPADSAQDADPPKKRADSRAPSAEAVKKELKKFEGLWRCTRLERDGRPRTSAGDGLLIEDEGIQTLWGDNNKGGKMAIRAINPAADPKTIDVEWVSGQALGRKLLGVYRLDGDKLEICWSAPDAKKRPAKFDTKPGAGGGEKLAAYKREKDE